MEEKIRFVLYFNSGLCGFCKHFSFERNSKAKWICDAFPDGMPWEISEGEFDHRQPHPDDNGILFEIRECCMLPDWVEEDFQWHKDRKNFEPSENDEDEAE